MNMKSCIAILASAALLSGCASFTNMKKIEAEGARADYVDDVDVSASGFDKYKGEHKLKKIGVLSVFVTAHGKDLIKQSTSYKIQTTVTTTSKVTFSPENFQYVVNKVQEKVVKEWEKHGFEVVPASQMVKTPGYRDSGSSHDKADKNLFGNYKAASYGGNSYSGMLMQDDEYLDGLAKKTGADAFVYLQIDLSLENNGSDSKDGVRGFTVGVSANTFTQFYVPYSKFKAAGGSSGLFANNHAAWLKSKQFEFEMFFPNNGNDTKGANLVEASWNRVVDELSGQHSMQVEKFLKEEELK